MALLRSLYRFVFGLGAHILLSFVRVFVVDIIIVCLFGAKPVCIRRKASELATESMSALQVVRYRPGRAIPAQSMKLVLYLSFIPHSEGNSVL
jgi:hypothetical protein